MCKIHPYSDAELLHAPDARGRGPRSVMVVHYQRKQQGAQRRMPIYNWRGLWLLMLLHACSLVRQTYQVDGRTSQWL
jgi:hypothetical protein